MYRYKVKISYLVAGTRITKYVIGFYSSAAAAAEEVRNEYEEAPGIRIEKVWVDIGTWWESNEVEANFVEKERKTMDFDGFMDQLRKAYDQAVKDKERATDSISYASARARMTAIDDAMVWALEYKDNPVDLPEMENPVP